MTKRAALKLALECALLALALLAACSDDAAETRCVEGTWDHDGDPSTACQGWTECADGGYEATAGSATSDRVCEPYPTVCGLGEYVVEAGPLDRVCAACPEGQTSKGPNAAFSECIDYPAIISAGALYSCSRRVGGQVLCWGLNDGGQADAPTGVAFNMISAGGRTTTGDEWGPGPDTGRNTCGIRSHDGGVVCWGDGAYHLIGSVPSGAFDSVSVSGLHACAVRRGSNTVACWGYSAAGLGGPGGAFDSVSAGSVYTCGIRSEDGELVCWGQGLATEPYMPFSGTAFDSVSTSVMVGWCDDAKIDGEGGPSCAVRRRVGGVGGWGADGNGQVSSRPSGVAFDSVSAGVGFTCAVRSSDGEVYCWGADAYGQVSGAPSGVAFDSVSAGATHACGIRRDDLKEICWGDDVAGQVGL
jgi:hypothetical protein